MTLREEFEDRERRTLSGRAALSAESRGREQAEDEHDYRTAFQRDRDRILHSKAFRRLKRKTQVFLAPESDHYRTRLSHTLDVAQISRTVARALFLNEDLAEAIALGHDIGHAPFGHAGEAVFNDVYEGGFNHAEHGLRIVDHLESTRHGRGLNLTFEVRDGILNHSRGKVLLQGRPFTSAATLEAAVVSVCDAVAYINHDVDDAIRAQLITLDDLPRDAIQRLGQTTSERINTMVGGLIEGSAQTGSGGIAMTPDVREASTAVRTYLYEKVYPSPPIRDEIDKAKELVRKLYFHFLHHPTEENAPRGSEETVERRTVDFIAGMTDQYAIQLYGRLFLPGAWPS